MTIIRAFLAADEVAALIALASQPGWLAGRQGTGYDKLPLADHPLVPRAIAVLGTPYENYWDVYLLRYVDGAHVPDHVDAAQHGRRHRRLNAVLAQPRAGGALFIDDVLVELAVGDAVLFDPDREVHRVSPVEGTRLVFSVGAWI
ncbi:MAG: 2OG-Fe(II) oxygenase [Myxococcota bacterium]|nr:2OG-Fe(II) oxygenase [Myxococcota bacterium]